MGLLVDLLDIENIATFRWIEASLSVVEVSTVDANRVAQMS